VGWTSRLPLNSLPLTNRPCVLGAGLPTSIIHSKDLRPLSDRDTHSLLCAWPLNLGSSAVRNLQALGSLGCCHRTDIYGGWRGSDGSRRSHLSRRVVGLWTASTGYRHHVGGKDVQLLRGRQRGPETRTRVREEDVLAGTTFVESRVGLRSENRHGSPGRACTECRSLRSRPTILATGFSALGLDPLIEGTLKLKVEGVPSK
jgi:hypothetical protein